MASKSYFPIYLEQLKVQKYNKSPKVKSDANEILRLWNERIQERFNKPLDNLSAAELASIPFDINEKSKEHREFWGATGKQSYEEANHFLGIFGKKNKAKRQKFFKGIGKGITKLTQGIGKTLGKIVSAPAMLVLLPFKGAMKKALDKKGISHSNKMRDIAEKFAKNVAKSYDYAGYESYYVHNESNDFDAGAVIDVILKFFSMLKEKIGKGLATAEEMGLIDEVDKEEKQLEANPEYKAAAIQAESLEVNNSGAGMFDMKSPIMWLIIALVAFKFMR